MFVSKIQKVTRTSCSQPAVKKMGYPPLPYPWSRLRYYWGGCYDGVMMMLRYTPIFHRLVFTTRTSDSVFHGRKKTLLIPGRRIVGTALLAIAIADFIPKENKAARKLSRSHRNRGVTSRERPRETAQKKFPQFFSPPLGISCARN